MVCTWKICVDSKRVHEKCLLSVFFFFFSVPCNVWGLSSPTGDQMPNYSSKAKELLYCLLSHSCPQPTISGKSNIVVVYFPYCIVGHIISPSLMQSDFLMFVC